MANNRTRKTSWLINAAIGILIGGFALGLATNMIADEAEALLREQLGEYYLHFIVALFVVSFVLLFYSYFRAAKKQEEETANSPKEDFNIYRNDLIEGLEKRYNKRIEAKMNHQLRFELQLQLEYTTEATSHATVQEEFIIQSDGESTDFDKLFERYDRELKRLMILGHPGAGKSMILLRMGLKLLENAKTDAAHPIAVIINLASWRKDEGDFEQWLERNLTHAAGEYGISKDYAAELVKAHQILPLLDGFDEIPEADRDSCLIALKSYIQKVRQQRSLQQTFPEVIVCSRIVEYHLSEIDAPVFAIAKIQSLKGGDIHNALSNLVAQNDLPAKRLQKVLQNQPALLPLFNTAFHVHTALSLADGETDWWAIRTTDDLLEKYVERELTTLEKKIDYTPKNIKHWLSWLAWKLNHMKKGVNFELVDLQVEWAEEPKKINWGYGLLHGLFMGLFIILISGDTVFSLVGGLFIIIMSKGLDKIQPEEIRIWNWQLFTKMKVAEVMIVGLIRVLLFGFSLSLFIGIFVDFTLGLIISFSFSFGFFLVVNLIELGYTTYRLPKSHSPYQRLKSSFIFEFLKNTVILCVIFFTIIIFTVNSNLFNIGFGLFLNVYYTLYSSIFKHIFLRFSLYREENMPLQYVTFLDAVAEQSGLMEKDGGQWRFRHQLIQDYFSEGYGK